MAEVILRLKHNPKTGQRELVIDYESDADMLPHEHEKDHRAAAEMVLGQSLGNLPDVKVERIGATPTGAQTLADAAKAKQAVKNSGT